ncbi:unnamed protein product [Boreogadus saida]
MAAMPSLAMGTALSLGYLLNYEELKIRWGNIEFPCVVEMAAAQRSAQTNKGVEVKGEPQCGRADCLG